MKKLLFVAVILLAVFLLPAPASASPIWYSVTFTGLDVWTYSADNAAQARTNQTAPRRYRDWTQVPPANVIQATTYGLNGGLPGTGFNAWAPASGFAFDSINLWGKGGVAAAAWGEKYVTVPDDASNGITSWEQVAMPTGWTGGIVLSNQPYNPGPGAFPVWRSGTGAPLSLANMNDPSFRFTFNVLISNPDVAFEPDGHLRVFFGGYSDDFQGIGPDNYEVSGVMELDATPVPEPGSMLLFGSGLMGLATALRKRLRK
jgi:hypothetical protein